MQITPLTVEQKIALAQNPNLKDFFQYLRECRIPQGTMIAEDQWNTLVNFMTMEIEAALIGRAEFELAKINPQFNGKPNE